MNESNPMSDQEKDSEAYCLLNTNLGAGEVRDSSGKAVWHYRPPKVSWVLGSGFFRRPDFIFTDSSEKEVLRVAQTRRFPLRGFVMTAGSTVLGHIEERSAVSTSYTVSFTNGPKWSIRKPLFSVNVVAATDNGEVVRIYMHQELVWYIHRGDTKENVELIAALTFIHSEHSRT